MHWFQKIHWPPLRSRGYFWGCLGQVSFSFSFCVFTFRIFIFCFDENSKSIWPQRPQKRFCQIFQKLHEIAWFLQRINMVYIFLEGFKVNPNISSRHSLRGRHRNLSDQLTLFKPGGQIRSCPHIAHSKSYIYTSVTPRCENKTTAL